MRDVFLAFLRLGVTSFGGPIAHIGYFREEFVGRRRWLSEGAFAQIVALCSVLPGPTSSQVGIVIGLTRAGIAGGLAAWIAFTAPSAIAMMLFGMLLRAGHGAGRYGGVAGSALAGLGLAAAGVVALAVLTLARSICVDRRTKSVAVGATIVSVLLAAHPQFQWLPIVLGALTGLVLMRDASHIEAAQIRLPLGRRSAAVALVLFAVLVAALARTHGTGTPGALLATCVRAGSLVFGGGHVVLPLLQTLVSDGLVRQIDFFAGYAGAQAVPGPLFTFAAFLGADNASRLHGPAGAAAALVAIFLPSFILLAGVVPFWNAIRRWNGSAPALRGANAAVVGLLAALLYHPIFDGLLTSPARFSIALVSFGLLAIWRVAPWIVVIVCGLLGAAFV